MINNTAILTDMGLLSELAYLKLESNIYSYQPDENGNIYSFFLVPTFYVGMHTPI